MKKYIVLDDSSIKTGGTALTLSAILEDRIKDCFFISPTQLDQQFIFDNSDKFWIIGNMMTCNTDNAASCLLKVLQNCKFIKLEFDYNFCPYRGRIPHYKLANQNCDCPHGRNGNHFLSKAYDLIAKNSLHSFYMSERQRSIYIDRIPLIKPDKTSILSSCFSSKFLNSITERSNKEKNNKYAILQGYGGWHSEAKGLTEAKNFCEANGMQYDILPAEEHESYLQKLSSYKGMVFLPIIEDTCPRCIIEARLLNLEVIVNTNCQHVNEFWWRNESETLKYLKTRTSHFWNIIDKCL